MEALTAPSVHPMMNQKRRQVRSPLPSQRPPDDTNIAHKWQVQLVHNHLDTLHNRCVNVQLLLVTRKLNATETKRDFDESYNQNDEQQSTLSIWIELWASWLGPKDCWNLFALSKWEFTIFVLAIVHRSMYTMYIHEYCLLFTVFVTLNA